MKKYVTHECTSNISFLIFKHIVFRPIFSLKPEFYTAEKEISSSFQKCIGLYTFYAVVLRNLTSNWPSTIDVNDDKWRHLFTTILTLWRQIGVSTTKPLHGDVTPHAHQIFMRFSETIDLHGKLNCGPSFQPISSVSKFCSIPGYDGTFCENCISKAFSVEEG